MGCSRGGLLLACLALLSPSSPASGQTAWEQLRALPGARGAAASEPPEVLAVRAVRSLLPGHARGDLPADLGRHPLVVVHATRDFDQDASAAAGIDAAVRAFKAAGRPAVYLVHDQTRAGYDAWYTADRAPDHELFSEGGEHDLPMAQDEVTVVGGFFGSYDGHRGCHTLAVRDAIRMHFEASARPFTVHLPIGAIYFYEEDAATRRALLDLDPAAAEPARLRALFDDFPRLFFLTDNFSDVPAFGHPYPDGPGRRNLRYRGGASVDVEGYSFELFFRGVPVGRFGSGPRQVRLELER